MINKKELRSHIRQLKQKYTDAELRQLSVPIMERLLRHDKIVAVKTILLYHALSDEVDTSIALQHLVKQGKTVLLPRVVDAENMVICHYRSPEDLRLGAFNIMEPVGQEFDRYDEIDVCVVPGMSFDSANNRLGRGKGYYDRFLARVPKSYKIGVCFDFQKLNSIPTDAHDQRVDEVL